MKHSKIEWTEATWNPSVGCNKVSAGCKFCYAEVMAKRLQPMGTPGYENGFQFSLMPERLSKPYQIKKPTKFFVNSMSDLFHEKMPFDFLDQIFDVIRDTPQHTYQILTKREAILKKYFQRHTVPDNVWLGVTVEMRKTKKRIDVLRKIDAKARPMDPQWAINIQKQCDEQDISFFFKQWGAWGEDGVKRSKKANGRILLGQEWNQESAFG